MILVHQRRQVQVHRQKVVWALLWSVYRIQLVSNIAVGQAFHKEITVKTRRNHILLLLLYCYNITIVERFQHNYKYNTSVMYIGISRLCANMYINVYYGSVCAPSSNNESSRLRDVYSTSDVVLYCIVCVCMCE